MHSHLQQQAQAAGVQEKLPTQGVAHSDSPAT